MCYILGGTDRALPPTISYLRPGFVAFRSDQIRVGERLTSVNGREVSNLTHSEILTLLRTCGDTVNLELEYDLNDKCFDRNLQNMNKCTDIVLDKESGSFGLTLRGGAYGPDESKNRPITVTNIRPGSPAHRTGRLRIGDRIISVNGIDIFSCTLAVATKILSDIIDKVALTIEYDVCTVDSVRNAKGALMLELDKPSGADLGVNLSICNEEDYASRLMLSPGSQDPIYSPLQKLKKKNSISSKTKNSATPYDSKRKLIFVKDLVPASIADRCGALAAGDLIFSIDGIELEHTTLAEAEQLLRGQTTTVTIGLVPRHLLAGESGAKFSKRMFAKKKDSEYTESNFFLRGRQSFYQRSAMSKKKGSPSNNNVIDNANNDIKNDVKMTYPNQQKNGTVRMSMDSLLYPKTNENNAMSYNVFDGTPQYSTNVMFPHQFTSPLNSRQSTRETANGGSQIRAKSYDRSHLTSLAGSINGCFSGIPNSQVCHTESQDVTLHAPPASSALYKGYGISLHRYDMETSFLDDEAGICNKSGAFYIAHIEKNSPADKCGRLQVGDRVIAINDWLTMNGSIDEATHILRNSPTPVNISVEFDIIETAIPPSGIFSVKLMKRGNNIGIIARADHDFEGKKGEPVIISEIKQGSAAHRCGSIQAGDKIISIDNIPLATCTIEESMRLLQRSGEIVKLCVQKNAKARQAQTQPVPSVIYSIELNRKGQPLGITIASSGEAGDPIVISQLAAGGLAEKTGALHVGDIILAINGESIEGRKVIDAMRILQKSVESVNLKMARCLPNSHQNVYNNPKQHQTYQMEQPSSPVGTPIQSIDSAVESLDDSPDGAVLHGKRMNQQASKQLNDFYNLSCDEPHNPSSNTEYEDSKLPPMMQLDFQRQSSYMRRLGFGKEETQGTTGILKKTLPKDCCSCYNNNEDLVCDKNKGKSECSSKTDANHWMNILEALETVGEDEMLKKLEETILSGNINKPDKSFQHNIYIAKSAPQKTNLNSITAFNQNSNILRNPSIQTDCHSQRTSEQTDSISTSSSGLDCMPKDRLNLKTLSNPYFTSELSHPSEMKSYSKMSSIFKSSDMVATNLHKVSLVRDPVTNSFGFSVSDGDCGIYINTVSPNGPADKSGLVKPLDKLIEINDQNVTYLDCDLALPLLLKGKVELVLQRDIPLQMIDYNGECKSPISCVKDSAV
uniref:Glutamate receptor-interacting protein 2 n=1 Tax=Rhabditophanes sp. KR3021 TaxID=114890 RepID=A0AC35U8D4_9BILA